MASQQIGANKGSTLDRSRTTTTWQVQAEALVADEFDLDIRLVEQRSSRGLSDPVRLIAPGTRLRVMQEAEAETNYTCHGYTCDTCIGDTCPNTACGNTCGTCDSCMQTQCDTCRGYTCDTCPQTQCATCDTCVTCPTCITCDTCPTNCNTCPNTQCFTCDCPV